MRKPPHFRTPAWGLRLSRPSRWKKFNITGVATTTAGTATAGGGLAGTGAAIRGVPAMAGAAPTAGTAGVVAAGEAVVGTVAVGTVAAGTAVAAAGMVAVVVGMVAVAAGTAAAATVVGMAAAGMAAADITANGFGVTYPLYSFQAILKPGQKAFGMANSFPKVLQKLLPWRLRSRFDVDATGKQVHAATVRDRTSRLLALTQ
jgi:hypothetical protein